jgi:NADH-quinone oxidoreductase subunit H
MNIRMNTIINIYSIRNESIYNVLQILLIMLIVLSLSSLLTVLERKGLASSQRRLGPSYNGWFGLVQIVMDGIKLVYKDYNRYNNINNKYIMISCILNFVYSYLLFIFIYIDLILYINMSFLMLFMILVLMINHITIIICGIVINNSKWTILSSIRLILLYFMYDIIFILIIVLLSPNINITFYYINNILNLNQYIESQYYCINLFKYPILFFIYMFIVLIEAGRIPIDLIESESELIAGYSIEYSGFLYALFASAEYSITLFHSILLSILFFSYYSFYFLFIHITFLFIVFVIIRSTLPRFKYTHLFSLTFNYLLPITLSFILIL